MSRIVGIDLGTTNSLVAYVDDGDRLPKVIPDRDGQALLPSIVSFASEGVLVGRGGAASARAAADATVYSVKRLMGRGYEDVKEELCYLPFKVLPCEGIVKIQVGQREVTPPEVSAIVLRRSRSAPRRTSASPSKGRHHGARLLQRQPAAGHEGRRAHRRARRRPHPQRARPRRSPTGSSASARAWSPSTTWAAGRSTSRS